MWHLSLRFIEECENLRCSQAPVAEFSAGNCLDGKQCARLRSIRIAERSCFDAKKKATYRRSLSGITYEPSTAALGVERWMSFLRVGHVSRGASERETSPGHTTHAICGLTPFALLEKSGRDGASWRTRQRCLFTSTYIAYSETWPRAGFVHDGTAYQLPPLAPIIDETDCGLWPTPCARDAKGTGSAKWRQDNSSCDTLPDAVAETVGVPFGKTVVCQPMFVERLMQWPLGWTDLEPLAKDKFRQWLERHGGC